MNSGFKNKKGTSDRDCKCGSWKNHWNNYSGTLWPNKCCVYGCENKATLGAHVINGEDRSETIVPMCDGCNKVEETFYLKNGTVGVSANVADTCGRQNR